MGIISFLSSLAGKGIIDSVKDLVEDFVTTDKERFQEMIEKQKLQLQQEQLEIQRENMYLQDTQSARQTYAQITVSAAAPFINKIFPSLLAFVTIVLTFYLFWIFATGALEPDKKEIVLYILGVLSGISTQIYSFYFGSSMGSKTKEEALKNLTSGRKNE